jgi:GNAT superfamily N-acetyltransferase
VEPQPVTAELVRRLEGTLDAFGVARVEALAELPGNPLDLRIARFGDAVAPAARAMPELDFVNRISRLGPGDAGRLEEILAFYAEVGLRPWLEATPGVGLELPAGAALLGFQSVLCGPARPVPEPGLPVRETADADLTARLILEAFGVPPEILERHAGALARAAARSGGRWFVVEVEGRAAAGAILTIRDGTGYLAMAGTLPEFRGRGCQRALIAARIAAAAAAGCELIAATAEFASASQRNIERAGLRVAYTKPVLRLTPPAERPRAATA